jgi:hypothetical protein
MIAGYQEFLQAKTQHGCEYGFEPGYMNENLFPFQRDLVSWAVQKGRGAIFAECGLGKTIQQLTWAENVVRNTNGRVLILTPLAVAHQTAREADKFGLEAKVSRDGKLGGPGVYIANYERLHYFNTGDFQATVCDESSCLKNFDGKTKAAVTEFMRKQPYRLLCTATPAPNDYIELGTSSEALGELGFVEMLNMFFKKPQRTWTRKEEFDPGKYVFKGHAKHNFWRWVCSWARAVRKPSDMGYDDTGFVLPPLEMVEHTVETNTVREGWLFNSPAVGLQEQREERRRTIIERCEKVASLVADTDEATVCWCHLNTEGDALERMIPGAVQIAGKDSDDRKEEVFEAFQNGEIKKLVSKASIAGWGVNWQHCAHQTTFPSHSFEQLYQTIRRSWRFGQTRPVRIDMVTTEGEKNIIENLRRKQAEAEKMMDNLVEMMNNELVLKTAPYGTEEEEVPEWL